MRTPHCPGLSSFLGTLHPPPSSSSLHSPSPSLACTGFSTRHSTSGQELELWWAQEASPLLWSSRASPALTDRCSRPWGALAEGVSPTSTPSLLSPICFSVLRTKLQSQHFPLCEEGLLCGARLCPRSSLWQSNSEKFCFSAVSLLSFNLQTPSPALPLSLHPSQYLPRLWHGFYAVFAMVTTLPKSLNLETQEDTLTV